MRKRAPGAIIGSAGSTVIFEGPPDESWTSESTMGEPVQLTTASGDFFEQLWKPSLQSTSASKIVHLRPLDADPGVVGLTIASGVVAARRMGETSRRPAELRSPAPAH